MVEDVAIKGHDTLLYNALSVDLGYNVRWITPDTVAIRNSAYFDTAFDVVIWCGIETAAPAPSANADTVANSRVAFVSLLGDTWDEINLGVNSNGTNGRTPEASGLVRAINRQHWITRVLQDSLYLWTNTSVQIYGLVFPDSSHQIQPLVIDKDNAADTAFVHLCIADSGQTIINTGDGRNVAKGRRAFLGLFSVTSTARDSCQFYTIFNRVVAWAARDTLNSWLTRNFCFSSNQEIEDAWAEHSAGSDSLESYGGWGSLYTGFDYNYKVAFMKIKNDALRRKVPTGTSNIESFKIRTRLLAVANGAEDSLWESTNAIRLIKLPWWAGNATGQTNTPYVTFVHRYIAGADTFRWIVGGARGMNSDVVDTVLDSIRQNRGNAVAGNYFHWSVPPYFAARLTADTASNYGWVWHNTYNNQVGGINDAELLYHSSEASAVVSRPVITIRLTAGILARRRVPAVSGGLIGGIQ